MNPGRSTPRIAFILLPLIALLLGLCVSCRPSGLRAKGEAAAKKGALPSLRRPPSGRA